MDGGYETLIQYVSRVLTGLTLLKVALGGLGLDSTSSAPGSGSRSEVAPAGQSWVLIPQVRARAVPPDLREDCPRRPWS